MVPNMKSKYLISIFGFIVILLCISSYRVNCTTIVEMRLKEFEHPSNTLMNSKCCDTNMKAPLFGCFTECEIFFEISIKPYPGSEPKVNYIKTYLLADAKTTFKEEIQLNRKHKNPWIFTYDKPYVSY